jgi:phosphohistidine phosphatase
MSRLVLFRHAKTEERASTGFDRDRRLLMPRGQDDARLVGQALHHAGYAPDRVLLSPARRVIETWEVVSSLFAHIEPAIIDELYLANPDTILECAHVLSPLTGTTWLIGHNPGLHMAIANLCGRQSWADHVPTSTAAVFTHSGAGWMLTAYYTPKTLRDTA